MILQFIRIVGASRIIFERKTNGSDKEMIPNWHVKSPQDIADVLKVDLSYGLTEADAQCRLNESGPNQFIKQQKTSLFILLLRQLNNFLIWVLLGAVIICFLLGEKIDAIAIMAIVILNAIIGFILEYRADRSILSLQKMVAPKTTVFRDSHARVILASEIVPGDIILFERGDIIAADARLIELSSLKSNEASLTGESLPVEKNIHRCSIKTPLTERTNMVYMGSTITHGTGRAIVVATGMKTEMGHIAQMLGQASHDETPLQKKLTQIGSRLLWICFATVIVIFMLGLRRHIPFFKLFISSVSLAVAAIPEGIPAVVTIALALGAHRLARCSVLIRRMSAVETLGCLQIICTDKTGTLTIGEMTARKLVTADDVYNIRSEWSNSKSHFSHHGEDICVSDDNVLETLLRAVAACNNAELKLHNGQLTTVVGEPTEIALLAAAAKGGFWRANMESHLPRIKDLPFNSERKRMTVVCKHDSQFIAFIKGAPEIILERCTHILTKDGVNELTPNERSRMQKSFELMASEALRILAFAERRLGHSFVENQLEHIENNLVFLGLIGLQDPPDAHARESVSQCKMAGIKPVMITGDHPDTARAIAQELGIFNPGDRLLTGNELEKMSDDEFMTCVKNITVYARVSAEHKLQIVRAWKKHQMVVAMTGDGINDAPALKEASVGIAMGKTATAVTKEAADIIVIDNNFTSIVAGIAEGRAIYDNISKTLAYLLAGNFGELLVVFSALLIGWPLPLLPIQLLWINLITDGLPAIALATDKPEPGILRRPPRDAHRPFMDVFFFKRVVFVGSLTACVTLGAFAYEYLKNNNLYLAQNAAFSVLVTAELLRAYGARSQTKTIFQVGFFSNKFLTFTVVACFFLQIMIHYIPTLQRFFGVGSVSLKQYFIWIILGAVPLLILEIQKLLKKT